MAESRSSFLGSISPWSASRATTPLPKAEPEPSKEEILKPTSGLDHAISSRPCPSLRRYPRDCPPLKPRWYYAVDVAKRKPFSPELSAEEKAKPPQAPKKLVAFSAKDSQDIESAFQALDRNNKSGDDHEISTPTGTETKVPVNEDYLFDVHIEKRELEPAYWLGPVYEVRRGSWFYADGSPCDENLANQLEEGYLKLTPWKKASLPPPRSSSQPRTRPASLILDSVAVIQKGPSSPSATKPSDAELQSATPEPQGANTYRLFGSHMNTTVTYQDSDVAYLSTDDFMSRMSSSVYGRFGGLGGTKIVRGFNESSPPAEAPTPQDTKRRSKQSPGVRDESTSEADPKGDQAEVPISPKRTVLERQLSSLAGLPGAQGSEKLDQEEARQQEEQEMKDARETDGDDQGRKIEHLVLVTHGIGQRLGLRLDSINFIHDVNTLRKTMKAVYASAPDLQALNNMPKNCAVQVLPVCWRHLLDFPKQSLRHNRKEFDLADADDFPDEEYPSLQDITVEGVPAVRNLITDLAMDVLLYQSAYREHIASIVQQEANRVYRLFKKRTGFTGKVSLCGHSLGSAILFDILCRQGEDPKPRRRVSSRASRDLALEQKNLHLDFECDNFFCLGSPIALFQMLKGRTVCGRNQIDGPPPESPFDPDEMTNDPFVYGAAQRGGTAVIPITASSPKCAEFFNIFHPTDPIAYRIEPLISPAMAQMKPQPLPYTKKGLFAAPGIANISARVSQQVMSSWYSLTSGVASSLINRSLGITGEEQALPQDKGKPAGATMHSSGQTGTSAADSMNMPITDNKKQQALADAAKQTSDPENIPTLIDSEMETLYAGFQRRRRSHQSTGSDEPSGASFELEQEKAQRLKREEAKVRALNSNGRVDYNIQEGMFDVSLLASIASHLSYWADEDVNHFMISQMLKKRRGLENPSQ